VETVPTLVAYARTASSWVRVSAIKAAISGLFVLSPGSRALPFLGGGTLATHQAIKMRLTQRLSDLSTVEELVARFEVVAESVVTEVRVLFSQIGIPNTFIDPLNEF
jgi:hypothetical protein